MCGIAGVLYGDPVRRCAEDSLREMRDSMIHRGPDDAGVYTDGPLGLAHRRLSIIDLGTGHQPMVTSDERLCVVFNGEIYNYRLLRRDLEARGHAFRTNSDTEVLLYGYREWGDGLPARLNGIFAFAMWDKPAKRLFLARDHMGIKPLYYHAGADVFVFASEIKALIASGHVTPRLNLPAVPEYFVFRDVAGEQTLFRDVLSVPPGHSLAIEGGSVQLRQYWSPLAAVTEQYRFDEATEELSALVESAVQMQRMSDVPLGTFCSGGIDSSLVTALCALQSSKPVNTYSVGFHELDYDETRFARMVAKRYGTEHHELRLDAAQFAELLPTLIWHNDLPLNFANSVQIYAISQLAKQRVKVVLTGEGADELFGGYPRYRIPVLAARLRRLPRSLQRLLGVAARTSGERRLRKLAGFLDQPLADSVLYNSSPVAPARAQYLRALGDKFSVRTALLRQLGEAESPLRQVALLDQLTYLVSILNRQDKMSMAASIESRVPLLDYRIVEFANRLPDNMKQTGAHTKAILKRLAERYLPKEVVYRRKSGFGVPLAAWFRAPGGLGQLALDWLTDDRLPEFDGELRAQKLLSDHRTGRADHSEALWAALNYVLWKQRFGIA